jgi:outer membrane protein assembly factor BamA
MSLRTRLLFLVFLQSLGYTGALCQNKDSVSHKKFLVNDILVQGNHITKYSIIYRELTFKKGDTISVAHWADITKRSKDNLMNTSLFNFATIDTVRLATGELDVLIQVDERWYLFPSPIFRVEERNINTWWVEDHHRLDKADYGGFLNYYNMLGLKQTLSLEAQFGYTKQFGMGYSIPYITKKQAGGLVFNFSYSENREMPYTSIGDILTFLNYPAQLLRHSINATVDYTYRQGLYNTHYLEADLFSCTVSDTILKLTKDYLPFGLSSATFPEVKYYFKRDLRDRAQYPLDGYFCDFSINEYGLGIDIDKHSFNLLYFQASFHKYWTISPLFYYEAMVEGKVSQYGDQPYYLQKALGYSNSFVRGYELYVVDGNNYALVKNEVKFRVLNIPVQPIPIPFVPRQFNKTYFSLYLTAYTDWGYVGSPSPNAIDNYLANAPLWGNGFGLDFITYYDLVLRVEYSINKQGQSGFFLHFQAPM